MTISFQDCVILRTIKGSDHIAWRTTEAAHWPGPIYERTFYLCKRRKSENYYLFYTYDHYEGYMWMRTADEGYIPITPQLAEIIAETPLISDDAIKIDELLGEFREVANKLKSSLGNLVYYTDIRNDIVELSICISNGAYRATLALAGRILEACLKIMLERADRPVQKNWMVGKLLRELAETEEYFDPALKNTWNIINQQRIVGVHAKESVPIPSKHQAFMVSHAVLDVLNRIVHK